jgi:hypothetical protein
MELVQEMQDHGCGLTATTPWLHCRVFEDNSGVIELVSSVKNPKMRPRTRHINTKVSLFQKQGSRWYHYNSSSLNCGNACRHPHQNLR